MTALALLKDIGLDVKPYRLVHFISSSTRVWSEIRLKTCGINEYIDALIPNEFLGFFPLGISMQDIKIIYDAKYPENELLWQDEYKTLTVDEKKIENAADFFIKTIPVRMLLTRTMDSMRITNATRNN